MRLVAPTLVALLAACSSAPSRAPISAPAATGAALSDPAMSDPAMSDPAMSDPAMSDPEEYAITAPSRAAGEAIFTRTGVGDPYRTGLAWPVFMALQRAYPDALGGDTDALARRFGFVARPAAPASDDLDAREGLPVGFHLTVDPLTRVPFVVGNCTLCHAERLRWPGGEALVVGLGNRHVRVHDYDAALVDVTRRPDFTLARIAPLARAAAREHHVAWPPDLRDAIVRASLDGLRARAGAREALVARARGGPPGRVAVIESFAVAMGAVLGRAVSTGDAIGWAKVPDVVGFPQRRTLSWDAAGEGPLDVLAVEADFAAGARFEWFHAHPHQGASLVAYLRDVPRAPAFPGAIDRTLAAAGRAVFEGACAPCHGAYGDDGRVTRFAERVVPLAVVGTDAARADAVTDDFVRAANEPALAHGVLTTRHTGGYVPPVLTRVWARAPYGHAGQWPSLAALATRPDARPARFVVDLDAPIDLDLVGLRTRASGAPTTRSEFLHDGALPGLGVGGHAFLADCGERGARAVIEYLKTL